MRVLPSKKPIPIPLVDRVFYHNRGTIYSAYSIQMISMELQLIIDNSRDYSIFQARKRRLLKNVVSFVMKYVVLPYLM